MDEPVAGGGLHRLRGAGVPPTHLTITSSAARCSQPSSRQYGQPVDAGLSAAPLGHHRTLDATDADFEAVFDTVELKPLRGLDSPYRQVFLDAIPYSTDARSLPRS
jgi:hypothetical protein